MEPHKKEAKELVDKFRMYLYNNLDNDQETDLSIAKDFALIAIDKIIERAAPKWKYYHERVKKEINKL